MMRLSKHISLGAMDQGCNEGGVRSKVINGLGMRFFEPGV